MKRKDKSLKAGVPQPVMTTRIELPPTPPSCHPQYDPDSIQMTQNTATTTQFHITFAFLPLPPKGAFNFSQENKSLLYIYIYDSVTIM